MNERVNAFIGTELGSPFVMVWMMNAPPCVHTGQAEHLLPVWVAQFGGTALLPEVDSEGF